MVTTSFVGLGLVATSGYGLIRKFGQERRELKTLLKEVLEIAKVETRTGDYNSEIVHTPNILKMKKQPYGYDITLQLPKGYPVEKFRDKVPVIEQATASKIHMKYLKGRDVQLQLGLKPIHERMDYTPVLAKTGQIAIPYFTPFGLKYLDFNDETTCHIIVAGATRMGKSVFLRLLFTNIILSTDGNVRFFYINNKMEDYFPMQGVPQIPEPAASIPDAIEVMQKVKQEIERRKDLLRKSRDSVNVRQFREKHPEENVPPLFIIFDEYGRFAEDEAFQNSVQEVAETAGYLDVHLVIATQRPDATTVLKPRIRANILTRVCFQTADEKNSDIVVHTDAAFHLGSIRGRAVVLDGMPMVGQIPYVSEDMTMELLYPYRRDEDAQPERQDDIEVSEALPSFVTGPVGSVNLSRGSETISDDQPAYEKTVKGRSRSNHSKTERRVLPLHAKSSDHSHRVH